MIKGNIFQAASVIRDSKCTVVFTGAGISVESGIPPFRGPDGLWTKYNPIFLDINPSLTSFSQKAPKYGYFK
jgi:NAD-dependent deacetylase